MLSEIWSNVVFDGHGVVGQYIKPDDGLLNEDSLLQRDAKWIASHVSSSQYFLQIIKCDDGYFCRPVRSKLKNILSSQFIKGPLAYKLQPM